MACEPDIRCNIEAFSSGTWPVCYLCSYQGQEYQIVGCTTSWWPTSHPTDNWRGHKTVAWIMEHGGPDDGEAQVAAALPLARAYLRTRTGAEDGRGHFTLRYYTAPDHPDGHWALEHFPAAKTVPFFLANSMARAADEACHWFFDAERMLAEPAATLRTISDEEVDQRLRGYQHFIDIETSRPGVEALIKKLPPLYELPDEQKRRLVSWWENLHWGFLEGHKEFRWTPALGFWRDYETIYYLEGPESPVRWSRLPPSDQLLVPASSE